MDAKPGMTPEMNPLNPMNMDMSFLRDMTREQLIDQFRNGFGAMMPPIPDPLTMPVHGVRQMIPTRDGEIRILVYRPENAVGPVPVFFDIHGGGFVGGNAEDMDFFCDRIRRELGIAVIAVNYRKAPDHPYPAGVNDVYDAVKYVVAHADAFGIDPAWMAIGGHSAGGNLSAVVCRLAKESGEFGFRCQILDYPPLDMKTSAWDKMKHPMAIPGFVAAMFDACYFAPGQESDPGVSPVCATAEQLADLPPAVIATAEYDSLRDEAERYAAQLAAAGVTVTLRRFLGAMHGFTGMPDSPIAEEGLKYMINGLKWYLNRF